MLNQLVGLKDRLGIQEGSENELRNRSWVVAGTSALAFAGVMIGIDVGLSEVAYPVAAISESVSLYQAAKAAPLAEEAGYSFARKILERVWF